MGGGSPQEGLAASRPPMASEGHRGVGPGFLGPPQTGRSSRSCVLGRSAQGLYRQLLRGRVSHDFLFVAEDRDLLLVAPPVPGAATVPSVLLDGSPPVAGRATSRTPHVDLRRGARLIFQKLGSDAGCPELGCPRSALICGARKRPLTSPTANWRTETCWHPFAPLPT